MGFTAAGWSVLCLPLDWSVHFMNSVPTKSARQCSGLQYSVYLQTDYNTQSCACAFLLPCLASIPSLLNWKHHGTSGSTDCKYWESARAPLRLLGDLPPSWQWMVSGPRLWSWRHSSDCIFPGTLLHLNSVCPQGLALVCWVSSREGLFGICWARLSCSGFYLPSPTASKWLCQQWTPEPLHWWDGNLECNLKLSKGSSLANMQKPHLNSFTEMADYIWLKYPLSRPSDDWDWWISAQIDEIQLSSSFLLGSLG